MYKHKVNFDGKRVAYPYPALKRYSKLDFDKEALAHKRLT